MTTPTMGRIVHYQERDYDTTYPAIVERVNPNGTLRLWVLGPTGLRLLDAASAGGPDGDTPTPGCWNWPSREASGPTCQHCGEVVTLSYEYVNNLKPPQWLATAHDVAAHVTAWAEAFILDRCGNHVERQDTVHELQAVLVWIEEHDTGAA